MMHDSIYLDRRHFYFCDQRQSLMILIHEIYFVIILLHYVRCIYIISKDTYLYSGHKKRREREIHTGKVNIIWKQLFRERK